MKKDNINNTENALMSQIKNSLLRQSKLIQEARAEIEDYKSDNKEVEELLISLQPPPAKTFEQYFTEPYSHSLPIALKSVFSGKKGKQIRLMIEVLKDLGLIIVIDGENSELFRAMERFFGKIGTYNSIFQTYDFRPNNAKCKKDFSETRNIIEHLLKRL